LRIHVSACNNDDSQYISCFLSTSLLGGFHFGAMKVLYFVLFTFLFPEEWALRSSPEHGRKLVGFPGNEESNGRTLLQEYSTGDSNNTSTEYPVCSSINTHVRYFIPEVLTNVSGIETVSNAFGCCQLCHDTPRCEIWNRDRDTGECTLGFSYDTIITGTQDFGFDAGLAGSRIFRTRLSRAPEVSTVGALSGSGWSLLCKG